MGNEVASYTALFETGTILVKRVDSDVTVAVYRLPSDSSRIHMSNDGIVRFKSSDGTIRASIIPILNGGIFPPGRISYFVVSSAYNQWVRKTLPTTAYALPDVEQSLDITSSNGQWLFHWNSLPNADGNPGIFGPSGLVWHAGESDPVET